MARRNSLLALLAGTLAIAAAYASAFLPGDPPAWAGWAMGLGIPCSLLSVMVLGAVRGREPIGKLAYAFALSGLVLTAGFALALGLPATEAAGAPLYLGLPLRAAVVMYGIGLLPIVVLPIAYALTFDAQTLDPADLERVRQAGQAWAKRQAAAAAPADGTVKTTGSGR
jgi:O-antigen/teichoic acid export membrane protein